MDSQRNQIHKLNPRIDVLFPEWRREKLPYDTIKLDSIDVSETDLRPIIQPAMLAPSKPPAWQDSDLKKLL